MKTLFIYSFYDINTPQKPMITPETAQMGISYISSLLKMHGHDTSLLVLGRTSGRLNYGIIDKRLSEFKPDIVAFSTVSTEYSFVTGLARHIRKNSPKTYLIIGGAHVSLNPEGVLSDYNALCIGEGEFPVLELVSQLSKGAKPAGIQNLWIKD